MNCPAVAAAADGSAAPAQQQHLRHRAWSCCLTTGLMTRDPCAAFESDARKMKRFVWCLRLDNPGANAAAPVSETSQLHRERERRAGLRCSSSATAAHAASPAIARIRLHLQEVKPCYASMVQLEVFYQWDCGRGPGIAAAAAGGYRGRATVTPDHCCRWSYGTAAVP